MKKTLHYFFSMAFLQSVCMWTLISFIVFPINNVAAGQPDHSKKSVCDIANYGTKSDLNGVTLFRVYG
jgi:hypothetical protein